MLTEQIKLRFDEERSIDESNSSLDDGQHSTSAQAVQFLADGFSTAANEVRDLRLREATSGLP